LAAAYNNFGSFLRGKGEIDQAVNAFKQAIDVNPALSKADLARVHFNLASSLRDQKHYAQAIEYLQKALELEPDLPEARAELPKLKYQAQVYERGFAFSQDWFSINLPVWEHFLTRFVDVPDLRVLEIGSWEGRSTCWLIEHILTHPSARITCVDPFEGSVEHKVMCDEADIQTVEQRFDFNIAKTGTPEKVRKVVGASQSVLRSLIPDSFHLAYIDGSHVASDVLEDAILTWRLVKVGGMIIFDDYGFMFPQGIAEDPPRVAIDAFLKVFEKKVKLVHQGYQVLIEKVAE
jgi:tetratricopeptide (TPR) repeat protein